MIGLTVLPPIGNQGDCIIIYISLFITKEYSAHLLFTLRVGGQPHSIVKSSKQSVLLEVGELPHLFLIIRVLI